MTQYTCEACHGTFQSEPDIEAADEESMVMFNTKHGDPDAHVVCEPCWLVIIHGMTMVEA